MGSWRPVTGASLPQESVAERQRYSDSLLKPNQHSNTLSTSLAALNNQQIAIWSRLIVQDIMALFHLSKKYFYLIGDYLQVA